MSVFEQAIGGKNGRIYSELELYRQLHYNDRIKPLVDADRKAGKIKTKGEILSAAREHAKRLLKHESDTVKARVREMYDLQKSKKKSDTNGDGGDNVNRDEGLDPDEIQQ